jgi:hypothetical protein
LADSPCSTGWQQYKQKCFKVVDAEKTFSYDDAVKACIGSSLLTIQTKEEQGFFANFLFNDTKIVDNVWLGLKKEGAIFKWSDSSKFDFSSWLKGNPSNKTDYNCVQMLPESNPIGQWSDSPCNKKNIVVCQMPIVTTISLLNMLLETKNKLEEVSKKSEGNAMMFNNYLNNLANSKWMKYELFENKEGKKKAFFMPTIDYKTPILNWEGAVNLCTSFNATLVEIDSPEKEFLFLSYLGSQSSFLNKVWLNGQKDTDGTFKWLKSKIPIPLTKFDGGKLLTTPNDANYADLLTTPIDKLGKLSNSPKTATNHVICEMYVNF